MFESVTALRDSVVSPVSDYQKKMFHKIPDMELVKDRGAYLVAKAQDKVVLDIGCTGQISKAIREVAKTYYGLDKVPADGVVVVDLDHKPQDMPKLDGVELVICSEVLEHLANPGWFLAVLKRLYGGVPVIFTVPNAGAYQVRDGNEVVHPDHVSFYSYHTLKVLLERYKYEIAASAWYGGPAYKAEGIIMVAS